MVELALELELARIELKNKTGSDKVLQGRNNIQNGMGPTACTTTIQYVGQFHFFFLVWRQVG